jgi:hypothetical protein
MTRRLAGELILGLETRNLDGRETRASMAVDSVRGEVVVRRREEIWVGGLGLRHVEDGVRVIEMQHKGAVEKRMTEDDVSSNVLHGWFLACEMGL